MRTLFATAGLAAALLTGPVMAQQDEHANHNHGAPQAAEGEGAMPTQQQCMMMMQMMHGEDGHGGHAGHAQGDHAHGEHQGGQQAGEHAHGEGHAMPEGHPSHEQMQAMHDQCMGMMHGAHSESEGGAEAHDHNAH